MSKCEKCGAKTEYRVEGSTQGLFCTTCDWNLVATKISEIEQDITKYKLFLVFFDPRNKDQLKALAKSANINLLQARNMSKKDKPLVIEGEAIEVAKIKKLFDFLSIKYTIEPEFPY